MNVMTCISRLTYPVKKKKPRARCDREFRAEPKVYTDHIKADSPVKRIIGIDMVRDFPWDRMHLLYPGGFTLISCYPLQKFFTIFNILLKGKRK